METKLKRLLLFILWGLSIGASAQAPQSAEEKRAALLTPEYYTNWIGASFFTISTIEKELDVTPVQILDLTFFYDFGNCFVGMEANEMGVITQMTLRLFGGEAGEFINKAKEYGYKEIGKGKDLNIRSNTGKILPDVYGSDVTRYCRETKNGKVYIDVANSNSYASEYKIAIYRTK